MRCYVSAPVTLIPVFVSELVDVSVCCASLGLL